MANGEWLTQLMAGLGGAFTGAGQANERLAVEAERERLRQERELEKQRLTNQRTLAESLFKGPMTASRIQEFLASGGDITSASAARALMPDETKQKPTYEERSESGGTAIYEDGRFKTWKVRPPRAGGTRGGQGGREADDENRLTPAQARTERGRLQSDVEGAQSAFSSLMRQRPRQTEFLGEAPGAYESALKGFQAESTMAANRRTGAQQRLSAFEQEYGLTPPPAPGGNIVPNAGLQQQVAAEMQRTIQGIMADPSLDDTQKRQLIQRVNERASSLLRNR